MEYEWMRMTLGNKESTCPDSLDTFCFLFGMLADCFGAWGILALSTLSRP
jgi:hypothetical protein